MLASLFKTKVHIIQTALYQEVLKDPYSPSYVPIYYEKIHWIIFDLHIFPRFKDPYLERVVVCSRSKADLFYDVTEESKPLHQMNSVSILLTNDRISGFPKPKKFITKYLEGFIVPIADLHILNSCSKEEFDDIIFVSEKPSGSLEPLSMYTKDIK